MEEIRAIWVPRWEITSPKACELLVETAERIGFNTLFVQVRGRGDAYYTSRLEPRAEALEGQPSSFDPLRLILDLAARTKIDIHAWLNTNMTWESETPPKSPRHIVHKHGDWLMRTPDQSITWMKQPETEGVYTCPSSGEFRAYLRSVFLDVVRNYEVAGVHFDFIRYPNPRYCYCDKCLSMFAGLMGAKRGSVELTKRHADDWDNFRRSQINELLYSVRDAVKSYQRSEETLVQRPEQRRRARSCFDGLCVSAAVFGDSSDAYSQRFQDWKRWLRDGKLDLICPMAYKKSKKTFTEQITDAVSSSAGVPVCAGIGAYRMSPESAVEQIAHAREIGTAGISLFSYSATGRGCDCDYLKAVQF